MTEKLPNKKEKEWIKKEWIKKEWIKLNFINIAKHHKIYCKHENCNISLFSLSVALRTLGIRLTEEEREMFL